MRKFPKIETQSIAIMKPLLNSLLICPLLVVVIGISGCESDDDNGGPATTCKLVEIVSLQSYINKETESSSMTFSYNSKSQLTGMTVLKEERDDFNQILSTSNTSTQYDYSETGYLENASSVVNSADGSDESITTYISNYEYQNGRITKNSTEARYDGTLTHTYISLYEYGVDGTLIKYTNSTISGTFTSSSEFDFKTKKLVMTGYTGAKTEGELDANGYLIKEINLAGIERRYQYDAEGNLIRKEEWSKGKLNNATVYEYDDKVNPNYAINAVQVFKGFPDLKMYRIIYPIHNYTKETNFAVDNAGKEILSSSKNYAMQYNASGYPTSVTIVESNSLGTVVSNTTTTNAYSDGK